MGNMSYCRFENTLISFRECVRYSEEFDSSKEFFESLSESEKVAARRLLKLCRQFVEDNEQDE